MATTSPTPLAAAETALHEATVRCDAERARLAQLRSAHDGRTAALDDAMRRGEDTDEDHAALTAGQREIRRAELRLEELEGAIADARAARDRAADDAAIAEAAAERAALVEDAARFTDAMRTAATIAGTARRRTDRIRQLQGALRDPSRAREVDLYAVAAERRDRHAKFLQFIGAAGGVGGRVIDFEQSAVPLFDAASRPFGPADTAWEAEQRERADRSSARARASIPPAPKGEIVRPFERAPAVGLRGPAVVEGLVSTS